MEPFQAPRIIILEDNKPYALIEHQREAVPRLVWICEQVAKQAGQKWQLKKFDKEGIHIINKEEYLNYIYRANTLNMQ
jgi:hypothetical protein